eukprot:CAMPEP_0185327038 /NCGR_PEP_ID=MMETSP1363-20130426/70059_1 /TAXON_ID=38817 /ORGANISM="Gephyrocapsa oceanica, Strain RCC1303" /LENGTH=39 /DNA_ID= /DNA_START= /DNA_END= /DNA_ORIENTATION=
MSASSPVSSSSPRGPHSRSYIGGGPQTKRALSVSGGASA